MSTSPQPAAAWLRDLSGSESGRRSKSNLREGLVAVASDKWQASDQRRVVILEKAACYGADYVLFRPGLAEQPVVAEALIFVDDDLSDDEFAALHRRLWSWGGVPLVFRKKAGRVDLLRCAHGPDFAASDGCLRYRPHARLDLLASLDEAIRDPWWDLEHLQIGSLWDDPKVCADLLSLDKAVQTGLVKAIASRDRDLDQLDLLPKRLGRRLLVLSLLIAYLEDRTVLEPRVFDRCQPGATRFFEVLSDGSALCRLLAELEERFNGDVFSLSEDDRDLLVERDLSHFAELVEGRTDDHGQLSLWQLYSFQDLPVELISHVYQHFVREDSSAVFTPPFLVRLMLDEVLGPERLDRLAKRGGALLDPSCGSGVFLVEAYKRLIAHWRAANGWVQPDGATLRRLMMKVRGVDINADAVELAAFSLCLAMCEALDTGTLRTSKQLFPKLRGVSLHNSCFFAARAAGLIGDDIDLVIGNPPFASKLSTPGAHTSYAHWERELGKLPDKQVAYLFLLDSLTLLRRGGQLCLLQQYNFLYNTKVADLRRHVFSNWDLREVLDFISVRGLFGVADTKVIALVIEAQPPPEHRKVLHATFRRTGRVVAQRGFDIDYYDLHWLSREQVLTEDTVWRSNLVGGGRVLSFVSRLKAMRSLGAYAESCDWDIGVGFIPGGGRINPNRDSSHVRGKRYLPSTALGPTGLDESKIGLAPDRPIEEPRTPVRFSAPLFLVRMHADLHHAYVSTGYLTYPDQIVGVSAPKAHAKRLRQVAKWFDTEGQALRAFVAASSSKVQKATALAQADIKALPFPPSGALDISPNERIVIDDIVDRYRGFIRLGQKSAMLGKCDDTDLDCFAEVYARQINAVYRTLRPLSPQRWPGAVCQPFVFGAGEVDWSGSDVLRDRLIRVLRELHGKSLIVHRIARVFDGPFVFLLKPDRQRYWIKSVALRDADETLAELHAQGL